MKMKLYKNQNFQDKANLIYEGKIESINEGKEIKNLFQSHFPQDELQLQIIN